jgi:hypothetical protein
VTPASAMKRPRSDDGAGPGGCARELKARVEGDGCRLVGHGQRSARDDFGRADSAGHGGWTGLLSKRCGVSLGVGLQVATSAATGTHNNRATIVGNAPAHSQKHRPAGTIGACRGLRKRPRKSPRKIGATTSSQHHRNKQNCFHSVLSPLPQRASARGCWSEEANRELPVAPPHQHTTLTPTAKLNAVQVSQPTHH